MWECQKQAATDRCFPTLRGVYKCWELEVLQHGGDDCEFVYPNACACVCLTEIISIAVRGTTISLDVNNHAQKQLKQKAKRTAAACRASEVTAKRETLVFMWIPFGLERLLCSVHQFCYHTCSLQLRCHVAVTACISSCSFPCRCVGRTCRISGKPPQR